ncbi:MAG: hypothetical protein GXC70_02850 [Sphingomonadaceae bacterium]|nr:hypothetical protein [Sphingomonadaceae bacterium]
MLQRLFLIVLSLCVALPALAMPLGHGTQPSSHDMAASAAHDCHKPAMPEGSRGDHSQKHECIGCIARYDGLADAAASVLAAEPLPVDRLAVQVPQTRAGPDTPPPRT